MRSTKEIKERLDICSSELIRMNKMSVTDKDIMKKPFVFKDGSSYNEISFSEVLTKYVSEKRTLKWILGCNE